MSDTRLHLGDCLDFLRSLPDGSVDAVITDPPYGIARTNHGGFRETRGMLANDDTVAFGQAVIDWAAERDIPIATFASPRRPWPGDWRNLIVWDKGGAVAGGGDMAKCLKLSWELIQVARNGCIAGGRDVSVWRHPVTPNDFEDHPTQKPVDLMERLLRTLFSTARTILDPFMGSGTTGVACVNTGRNFIGCEIDEGYFRIAERRITEAKAKAKKSDLPIAG